MAPLYLSVSIITSGTLTCVNISSTKKFKSRYEQGLCLSFLGLEHSVELGSKHNVALHFELTRHESLLTVELAVSEVSESVISKVDNAVSLALGRTLVDSGVLLQVNSLNEFLAASILHVKLKDSVGLYVSLKTMSSDIPSSEGSSSRSQGSQQYLPESA